MLDQKTSSATVIQPDPIALWVTQQSGYATSDAVAKRRKSS
jgi:hypothetical protein